MMARGRYILLLTLNVNGLNSPTKKDLDRVNGHKSKNCVYAMYKRPSEDKGTHAD